MANKVQQETVNLTQSDEKAKIQSEISERISSLEEQLEKSE